VRQATMAAAWVKPVAQIVPHDDAFVGRANRRPVSPVTLLSRRNAQSEHTTPAFVLFVQLEVLFV
jgi:hypothetical protein